MTKILVLAAESSRAKLYLAETPSSPLVEKADLIMPEGRMHAGDLVSDGPGSDGGAGGQGRHVMDEPTDPHTVVQEAFARQLVERLQHELDQNAFDKLVLLAPPAFLGKLRAELGDQLEKHVAEEIDKNLVQKNADELRDYISLLH